VIFIAQTSRRMRLNHVVDVANRAKFHALMNLKAIIMEVW
jgi:hypothetical protein